MNAYQTCHELMLENPGYVPRENTGITYVLLQLAETDTDIGISGMVINPNIPKEGSPEEFLRMEMHEQIAVISLRGIHDLMRNNHKQIEKLRRWRRDGESDKELLERLSKHFEGQTA